IRHAVPMATTSANESPLPQDVPNGAGDRPSPRRVLPSEDRQQFARPPPWVAAPHRHNALEYCRRHGVRMGQRRPGPLDERRDAASLIALHPFVAGLICHLCRRSGPFWFLTPFSPQSSTLVHPRQVLGPALRYDAAALILIQNHPTTSSSATAHMCGCPSQPGLM